MSSSRRVAGRGHGALAGSHPAVALGLVPSAGTCLWDEFLDPPGVVVASRYGDRLWEATAITSGVTFSAPTPTAHTERGILQLATAASANTGSVLSRTGGFPFYRYPPPGSIYACKVQVSSGTADYELWSGFADAAARVGVADATQFIGIRSLGSNLFGVCKDGAGAGNESTVDLGVACEGTWRVAGFEVTLDSTVQFFVLTLSDVDIWDLDEVGDPVSTNLPSTALLPVPIGWVTTTAASQSAQVDWVALGGRTAG